MNNYYVMSIQTGKNILDTTRGLSSFLFHNFEDINDEKKIIEGSKYIARKTGTIYLNTAFFKKFNFSIRSILDMHIVSNEMLELLEEFNVNINYKFNLIIVNSRDNSELLIGRYYLVKFNEIGFTEVLNINESYFEQEYPDTIDEVNKLKLKDNVNLDFFIISELRMNLKTPICSSFFKDRYNLLKLKGVEFYDINIAPWFNGTRMEIEHIKETTGEVKPFVNPI